jgi:hypothetical protein
MSGPFSVYADKQPATNALAKKKSCFEAELERKAS